MNPRIVNEKLAGAGEAEATLRLLAGVAAPEGLAERVKAGLQASEVGPVRGRVLAWPAGLEMQRGGWLQAAAAAALLLAVAGGGWGVARWVAPEQTTQGFPVAARPALQGGFSAAGAMRRPETLVGPLAPVPALQKKRQTSVGTVRHGKAENKAQPKEGRSSESR